MPIERLGRPDYAVECNGLLIGYIELKEPEKGANPGKYKGHDAAQWLRFKNIPNIIYTSANEWALYQNGELVGKRIRFSGDVCTDGDKAIIRGKRKGTFFAVCGIHLMDADCPRQTKRTRCISCAVLPPDPR